MISSSFCLIVSETFESPLAGSRGYAVTPPNRSASSCPHDLEYVMRKAFSFVVPLKAEKSRWGTSGRMELGQPDVAACLYELL